MKKNIIIAAVIVLFVGVGAFYGGMQYAQSKTTGTRGNGGFANLSPAERQARLQQFGANGAGGRGTRANGGGFVSGEILSKDDKSVTLKLSDGGSKIILFSSSTQIMKSQAGSPDDLKIGENLIANGETNQDGSITAKTIQLRPKETTP